MDIFAPPAVNLLTMTMSPKCSKSCKRAIIVVPMKLWECWYSYSLTLVEFRVDNFQNTGIMDALRHNYLRAMKLFVGGKTGNTSAIVESYTFLFHRTSGITTVELREADDSFHVENLQRSFKKAIASLLVSMRGLPTLPSVSMQNYTCLHYDNADEHAESGRNLSVCLHYQDTCPLNYQPVGFLEADKSRALLWEKGDDSLHTTGFELADYAVSVKVRKYVNDGGEDNLLSRQIRELQQTSSRDHGLPPTFDAAASKKKRKRMAEDQPSSSFRQSRRRSLPPDQLDCENAQIVEVEKDGIVEEKKQVKISTSERLVHFSSSTHTNTTSNEDSERWC